MTKIYIVGMPKASQGDRKMEKLTINEAISVLFLLYVAVIIEGTIAQYLPLILYGFTICNIGCYLSIKVGG